MHLKLLGLDDRQRLLREIVDDPELGIARRRAGPLHPPELRELIVRRGFHDDILPVVERHRHPVVRQDLAGDLRHPREDGTDVEHARNRTQQLDRAFDVRGALALHGGQPRGFRQPLVRQGDGDVVGEPLHERQVSGRIRVRAPREQRQHANRDAVDVDRCADAGREAAGEAVPGTEHPRLRQVAQDAAIFPAQQRGRAVAGAGKQLEARTVVRHERQVRLVVRHDAIGHGAEVPEDVANVERARERRKQFVEGVEIRRFRRSDVEHGPGHERLRFRAVFGCTLIGRTAAISLMRSELTEMNRCWPDSRTVMTPASARIFR